MIRSIDIVGDTRFPQKQLLDQFHLKTPNWLSWYRQDDRYSRQTLKGDLERLRDFYMNRGYANFQIRSTQVQISPDKKDIFITVALKQGPAAQLSGGIGYSAMYKLMLNASFADADFLGTGNRLAINLSGGAYEQTYSLSHTNPYATLDGLSLTEYLTYRHASQAIAQASALSMNSITTGVTFG